MSVSISRLGLSIIVRAFGRGYMIAFQWKHIISAIFHGLNFRTWKLS